MISRRCSLCSENWPNEKIYTKCPDCGEETSRMRDATPMDSDEAYHRKTEAEFNRFYENWDSTHDPKRLEPTKADRRRFK